MTLWLMISFSALRFHTMATTGFLQQLFTKPDGLNYLADEAKEFAFQHGLIMSTNETPNSSEVVTYYPITLFPSPLPKATFLQALAVQTHFNTLMDKISQDQGFLEEALAGCIHVDDFTAKLFGIYKRVQQEGQTQSIVVGLNRSDYMVEQRKDGTSSLKQVEINTIAAGGFGVLDWLPPLHRHIMRSAGLVEEAKSIVDANVTPGMCAALIKAWELYGEQKAVILFLIEKVQIYKLPQRYIENELWKRNIHVIRARFEDVSRTASLDDEKKLYIDGLEVAVVYFRYGYMPDNYTEQAWEARLLMERSLAVKCPDIGTHLAGSKKVQQVLTQPGVLERFFPDQPQVVEQIRATFTGLYPLDMGPEGDKIVEMALADPDQFVLKPQREGGGNNLYGAELFQVLQAVKGSTKRMSYILMDKINSAPVQNVMLRQNAPIKISNCLNELGVFGAYVRKGTDMIMNECVGHLLKTKDSKHSDGGVTTGRAVMDSVFLI